MRHPMMTHTPTQAPAYTLPFAQTALLPQEVCCTRKRILMIVGSLRKGSLNLQLAQETAALLEAHAEISFLDYARLPWLNQDIDFPPAEVQRIRTEVFLADGLWFFTPEYHSSYPGILKNLLDWLSIPRWKVSSPPGTVIQGKKAAISGAGGQSAAGGARQKLTELLKTIRAIPMEEPQTGVTLSTEALVSGSLTLSLQDQIALGNQAEAFLRFLEENGPPKAY